MHAGGVLGQAGPDSVHPKSGDVGGTVQAGVWQIMTPDTKHPGACVFGTIGAAAPNAAKRCAGSPPWPGPNGHPGVTGQIADPTGQNGVLT
jgi:hypothetical protein